MISYTYLGKKEEYQYLSDLQALKKSLEYMFQNTTAKHGCILTFLHKEEILIDALSYFIAGKKDEESHIRVDGLDNRIVDIFPFEYFGNIGVSVQKTFQGFRFDYLSIIGSERVCGVNSKIVSECLRRFEYLI